LLWAHWYLAYFVLFNLLAFYKSFAIAAGRADEQMENT